MVLTLYIAPGSVLRGVRTPERKKSREEFRAFLEGIDDPKVELHWFEEAKDIGVEQGDYLDDGVHFTAVGLPKMAAELARLIRPRVGE